MEIKSYKENIMEGIRVGLIAFLICFAVIAIVATIINYVYIDDINRILNGSLSGNPTPTTGSLLLITSLILNLSVFNNGGVVENGGSFHIGMLAFAVLPTIAFMIADRRGNKKGRFNFEDMLIYSVSSIVFGVVLYLFSMMARGRLLGVELNFSSPVNFMMTIVIVLAIQFFIGLNYNKIFTPGIQKTRLLLRVFLGIGIILGAIGIIVLLTKYVGNLVFGILATLLLLPNLAVYIMFTFMGASIEFGNQLHQLMSQVGVDISFATLPIGLRVVFVVFFFIVVLISIWKLESEHFLEELLLFGTSFSLISLILAYMTKMNLGIVKNLLNVQFGINYVFAFVVPFIVIMLAGIAVLLVRYLTKEIKSINK